MSLALVIEPLSASHDRQVFSCGVPALDRYLREQAGQDIKRRIGNCFVAVDRDTGTVAAYYTLSASSIPLDALPPAETKKLPRYPVLPATLIARLAVDAAYQARRVGSALLIDAIRRSADAAPAAFTLLVDAKDEQAAAFYRRHGFIPLESRRMSLFLPIATGLKLFEQPPRT